MFHAGTVYTIYKVLFCVAGACGYKPGYRETVSSLKICKIWLVKDGRRLYFNG